MIRTVIVDDELHCIDRLSGLLTEHCQETVELVGTAQSVADGVETIRALRPDLVFLDVQIHEHTGFDLLKQLSPVAFEVVFTTAFDQYAVQAFRFSAADYLLKPIQPDELRQTVAKLAQKRSARAMSDQLTTLFHNLNTAQNTVRRIGVPVADGLVFLPVNDIIRCQSDVNYTILFLKDKQKLIVARTLKEFDELLTDANFFRVHHSHLINLAYVKSYRKGKGGTVLMTDNSEIDVSTRRKDEFLEKVRNGRF